MTTLDTSSTERALRYCRDLTRRRARNFYYGLRLLPEPQRSALYAVYAWMRQADDVADGAGSPVPAAAAAGTTEDSDRERIDELWAATEDALAGRPVGDDPVLLGLRDTAARFDIDAAHFRAMLDGQLDDLDGRRYTTFDDLREYCERVASSVGLVCISIWGFHDRRAPGRAVDRGIAFQLTNILRDFAEDFDAGRLYLPGADFARHGLTPEELRACRPRERCRAFLLEQCDRAESFYRSSAPLDGMIEDSCRPTLWAMTTIYRRLLQRMRRDPEQIIRGPRVRLTAFNKGTIAIRAKLRARGVKAARP